MNYHPRVPIYKLLNHIVYSQVISADGRLGKDGREGRRNRQRGEQTYFLLDLSDDCVCSTLPAVLIYTTSKSSYLQLYLFASSFQAASPFARRIQKNALYFFIDNIFELVFF